MYERFFGFRESPFDLTPNPHCVVPTRGHREAISSIEYAIASRKGITFLVGEAGCGKTMVVRAAIARQPSPVQCVLVTNPALTRHEFVELLADSFGLSPRAAVSKTALLAELKDHLLARHASGETAALLVDEAQCASRMLLEEIRLLANIETHNEKLISIVLIGQPELARRLQAPRLTQLKQRIAHVCELRPLTETETAIYILSRIAWADAKPVNVFTAEAIHAICHLSHGIPRIVNVLADNALIAGMAIGQRPVGLSVVEEVAIELRIAQHRPMQDDPPQDTLHAATRQASHAARDEDDVVVMPTMRTAIPVGETVYERLHALRTTRESGSSRRQESGDRRQEVLDSAF